MSTAYPKRSNPYFPLQFHRLVLCGYISPRYIELDSPICPRFYQ